jgi:chromosome segregation ATPase
MIKNGARWAALCLTVALVMGGWVWSTSQLSAAVNNHEVRLAKLEVTSESILVQLGEVDKQLAVLNTQLVVMSDSLKELGIEIKQLRVEVNEIKKEVPREKDSRK